MAGLEDLLGAGDALKQLLIWGLFNQMIAALTAPYLSALTQDTQSRNPVNPLSAADAATAVNRSFLDEGTGEAYAAKNGISPAVFGIMRHLAGDAPSPQELVEALRRGLIDADGTGPDSTSFEQGISETNLLDKWTDVMHGLAQQWPTPTDALRAALQGQISQSEGADLYQKFGGDPQWYQLMFNTEGSSPTPMEAIEMALRGIIPWAGTGPDAVTFQQAFMEGPWRDKWQAAYQQLATYIPTPAEVAEFVEYGQVTDAEALQMMAQRGVTGVTAAAMLHKAHLTVIRDYQGQSAQLIMDLYFDQVIDEAAALAMLAEMNYSDSNARQMIAYTDMKREISALQSGVSRVGSLYIAHKITQGQARDALTSLGVPPTQFTGIISKWDLEAKVNVKVLSEAQITDAWEYDIMTLDEAIAELGNLGYTPYDAWVLLSVKAKAAQPGKPPGPPPAQAGVTETGTT